MNTFSIAVLPGDGIGPEVTDEALKVLDVVQEVVPDLRLDFAEYPAGANEYLRSGSPLPEATFEACRTSDAVLLGAMGMPHVRWPNGTEMAPQLDLREQLDLYAGVRPIKLFHESHTPLKGYRAGDIDLVIFRENTEGLFFSRKGGIEAPDGEVRDVLKISRRTSEKLFRAAFREAQRRRGRLALVDKANVLPSMVFFRAIFVEIAREFPDVETERVYVDATALYLVTNPRRFDVLVTENMFGDILSDLGAGLAGGMGVAPSADIGDAAAVFQPSHGSAPDIAGKGIANPVATILSAAMMLDWLAQQRQLKPGSEAETPGGSLIRQAVEEVLANPANRTRDLGGTLTCTQMGERIAERVGAIGS